MKRQKLILLMAFALSALSFNVFSQTTEYSLRSSVNLEMKIAKGLKAELAPEYRFSQGSGTSTFLVQAGLSYRFASWLGIGGYYRLSVEKLQDSESNDGSSPDLANRFAFDANTKISLKRFTPKFRLRYCNFSDFDGQTDDKSNYLRYRFALDYNIRGIKLTPFVSVELFQKLSSGLFSKARYSAGAEYELNKTNAISAGYSFDDKFKTSTKYHIFELTYKFRF